MSFIRDFRYIWKKDINAWLFIIVCIVGYFFCRLDLNIDWNQSVYYLRTLVEPIYQSGIAGGIFYILVTALPLYRSKDIRLHLLHTNLSDIIMELKESIGSIRIFMENSNIKNDYNFLDEGTKEFLIYCGQNVNLRTNAILTEIDILPSDIIKEFNDIFICQAFRRVYYHQYDDAFREGEILNFINELIQAIIDLEKLRDKIGKLF